jgi:hypothetical protein
MHGSPGMTACGAWPTFADMCTFMHVSEPNSLISATSLEFSTTLNWLFAYCGCWPQLGPPWFGPWSGFPRVESLVMYFLERTYTFVIFSNYHDSHLLQLKKWKSTYKFRGAQ